MNKPISPANFVGLLSYQPRMSSGLRTPLKPTTRIAGTPEIRGMVIMEFGLAFSKLTDFDKLKLRSSACVDGGRPDAGCKSDALVVYYILWPLREAKDVGRSVVN